MTEPKPQPNTATDEIEIDLRQVFAIVKKWSKLIVIMTILCGFSAGLISSFILDPVYEAETLLMVTKATDKLQAVVPQGEGLENVVSSVSSIPAWTMNTYLGQIKSEALMKRIITALDLEPNNYQPDTLAGMISAEVVKDSNLIEVKVNAGDPVLAADIANVLSSEYLKLMTEKNQEQLSRSVHFLQDQKKKTDDNLEKAVEELKEFQSQPRGVGILEEEFKQKSTDMVTYQSQLKKTETELNGLAASVNTLQAEREVTPSMITVEKWDNSFNTTVKLQEVNPLYVSLSEQISQKKSLLAEKEGEYQSLVYLTQSMEQELDSLQAELAGKRLEEERLLNEVESLRKTSQTLGEKKTETQIARSADLGDTNVIVISEASINENPIKPNKKLNVAIAVILGLMLFTTLAFILEYLDNTIKTPDDIEKELELPVMGVIPRNGN